MGANADKILRWISKDSPQTFLHSDYRADNLIIGSDAEHAMSAVLDWQLCSTGPGVYDLGDLVIKSMTVEDGAEHCKELLHLYYEGLLRGGVKGLLRGGSVERFSLQFVEPHHVGICHRPGRFGSAREFDRGLGLLQALQGDAPEARQGH